LDLDPEEPDCYAERGLTYHAMGRIEDARADFMRAIELDPSYRTELDQYLDPLDPRNIIGPEER
jgi:tetratricopeptide (TPR) repeat protein